MILQTYKECCKLFIINNFTEFTIIKKKLFNVTVRIYNTYIFTVEFNPNLFDFTHCQVNTDIGESQFASKTVEFCCRLSLCKRAAPLQNPP